VVADLPGSQPERRRSLIPASPVARVAIGLAIAVPVMVAAIAVVTALLSAWMLWAIACWYIFGVRHSRGHHRRYRHSAHSYGPRHAQRQAGTGPGRSFWT